MDMYPAFWNEHANKATGSAVAGELILIQHRWHEFAKPGMWLVTMGWAGWYDNINCIVDDFGNLIPITRH